MEDRQRMLDREGGVLERMAGCWRGGGWRMEGSKSVGDRGWMFRSDCLTMKQLECHGRDGGDPTERWKKIISE